MECESLWGCAQVSLCPALLAAPFMNEQQSILALGPPQNQLLSMPPILQMRNGKFRGLTIIFRGSELICVVLEFLHAIPATPRCLFCVFRPISRISMNRRRTHLWSIACG